MRDPPPTQLRRRFFCTYAHVTTKNRRNLLISGNNIFPSHKPRELVVVVVVVVMVVRPLLRAVLTGIVVCHNDRNAPAGPH